MIGRRVVGGVTALERGGDYCGPIPCPFCEDAPAAMIFLLPGARDADAHGPIRSVMHVHFPPHTYRECDDGSLEVRASIGVHTTRGGEPVQLWHGYLDEGHVWREC